MIGQVRSWGNEHYEISDIERTINNIKYQQGVLYSLPDYLVYARDIINKYNYTEIKDIVKQCNMVLKYLQERSNVTVSLTYGQSDEINVIFSNNTDYYCTVTSIDFSIPVTGSELNSVVNFYKQIYNSILLKNESINAYLYITEATPKEKGRLSFVLLDNENGLIIDDKLILGNFNYKGHANTSPSIINEMHLLNLNPVKDII